MKKNLVTLFAVAFVVAIIATGIFYGLFMGQAQPGPGAPGGPMMLVASRNLDRGTVLKDDDMKLVPATKPVTGGFGAANEAVGLTVVEPIQANEPVLQPSLTPRGQGSAGGVVPKGMRALSLHVADSGGVVSMLRGGQRIDVQMVTGAGAETQLKTVLQNVEVLNVPGPENGRPVVNVLVKPEEADLLGLADSAGRIRLVLRHPKDDIAGARASVAASSVMRGIAPARVPETAVAQTPAPAAHSETVTFLVRAAEAAASSLARLSVVAGTAIQPLAGDSERALRQLENEHALVTLSGARQTAANRQEIVIRSGEAWEVANRRCGVRIQMVATVGPEGKLRLRLQPEVVAPRGDTVATRRFDREMALSDGQSVAITGLFDTQELKTLVERIYPAAAKGVEGREVVILVTPKIARSTETAALHTLGKQ